MRWVLAAFLLFGCSSSGSSETTGSGDSSVSETSGGSDASDDGSVVDDSVAPPDDTGTFKPDVAAEAPAGGGCFATTTSTPETCATACEKYKDCPSFDFGTCNSGCNTRAAIMEKCANSTSTCNGFAACVQCALTCEQAGTCSGSPNSTTCCGNCANRPECIDNTLPVCDAIKKATVGCPPKMM